MAWVNARESEDMGHEEFWVWPEIFLIVVSSRVVIYDPKTQVTTPCMVVLESINTTEKVA